MVQRGTLGGMCHEAHGPSGSGSRASGAATAATHTDALSFLPQINCSDFPPSLPPLSKSVAVVRDGTPHRTARCTGSPSLSPPSKPSICTVPGLKCCDSWGGGKGDGGGAACALPFPAYRVRVCICPPLSSPQTALVTAAAA